MYQFATSFPKIRMKENRDKKGSEVPGGTLQPLCYSDILECNSEGSVWERFTVVVAFDTDELA